MNSIVKKLTEEKIILGSKIIFCILVIVWLFSNLFVNGVGDYISYKDYFYQNEIPEAVRGHGAVCIEQQFIAKGNILSNITLYVAQNSDSDVSIEIVDKNQKIKSQKNINLKDYTAGEWNRVAIDCNDLKRNEQFIVSIKGNDLGGLVLSTGNSYSKIFTSCAVNGGEAGYTLAVGLQFTYKYMLLGNILEIAIRILLAIAIAIAICYTIAKYEKISDCFKNSEKKRGLLYALYFSVSTVLLYNPLEKLRTEVTEFARVMGAGFNSGVDSAERVSNFNHWFIYFAIAFALFFLLSNYLRNKEFSGENEKAVKLLDNVIVIADVVLALRCITYFYNESQATPVFYYSDFMIAFIILLLITYIVLKLDKKLPLVRAEALLICLWMLALPASIVITHEWVSGREFMGFQALLAIVLILAVKFLRVDWNKEWIGKSIDVFTVFLSFIPFCTSFYIEFVTILNQHEIFWTHLRRNYFYAVCIGLVLTLIAAVLIFTNKKGIANWKTISYPAVIFGFSCLWLQIQVSETYSADIFETANSSVLISDLLNFGDIPIVQHYGGHMMTGVWEGIIYGLLNNDFMGANFSPYSGYVGTVIAILFFFFVKYLWNEDAAVLAILFFPFYASVSYWGLGLLMALAVMAYVHKNTYLKAALFWLAFIWCAIYRLDLGFAFAVACVLALLIYIIQDRNLKALKQLAVTLGGWGAVGLAIWCAICIIKNVNPVNRLIEFLMINLSNQNWAYDNIGDSSLAKYSWAYIFIPFVSIICLGYSVLAKRIRKNLGNGLWVFCLIIGLSYFFNFSRGLVRHSLAEGGLTIPVWSAYLFISIVAVAYWNKRELILPVYSGFILLNALFLGSDNFSQSSIADTAARKIGNYTETWTLDRFADEETADDETVMTYWSKLRKDGEVIERVKWNTDLIKTVQNYQEMTDALLNDGETFVDCINRTSVYPLLKRQNPVYVSQSPLQLSGQFTQEEFVKEMQGIPIVLMPYDSNNDSISEALDGVPNSYRYYKIFEYIYQNYVPLCTYENAYAVWCLPERYDEMAEKVKELQKSGRDITAVLGASADIGKASIETVVNSDGSLELNYTGEDPMLVDIQKVMDLSGYEDKNVTISIEYRTDTLGPVQMYYTTDNGENYTGHKVKTVTLEKKFGKIYFEIPVTKYTRIRLDTPEKSKFRIKSVKVGACNCKLADYGYDGPYLTDDGESYTYLPYVHNYGLNKLPVIWAEGDKEQSANNDELAALNYDEGIYRFTLDSSSRGEDGNYLKVSLEYNGLDQSGNTDNDDETVDATIKLGNVVNGKFVMKYMYTFKVKEGQHEYIFRVSNDYYWYTDEVDAVVLESSGQLLNVDMSILQGD